MGIRVRRLGAAGRRRRLWQQLCGSLWRDRREAHWSGRDLGSGGGIDGWKTELNSLGFNAQWIARDGLGFHFDVHSSTSESGRDNRFGSSSVIGGVLFTSGGRATIDYTQDLPVLSLDLPAGEYAAANMLTGGASFRNSYNESEVTQADLGGYWDINDTMSLDFGVTSTEVKNRTAFSNVQYDNWGGIGSPADYPDEVWQLTDVRSLFSGIPGANNPNLWNQRFVWDFAEVANYREIATGQSMAASDDFTDDLRTTEESMSLYLQYSWNFDIGSMNANLRAGIRYEDTDVTSSALVPIPDYITWVAANEYNITFGEPDFTELDGSYDYWLPNLDFSINVMEDLILRASYTETIGRPDWRSIQGGQTLNTLVRRNFGTGQQGNPGLLPLESKNYDLSAEWYYSEGSSVSAAYFFKDTSNYIGVSQSSGTPFDLPHPGNGLWYDECNAATGGADNQYLIRQCIADTYGDSDFVTVTPDGQILIQGVPGQDPAANFLIQTPNNQEDAEIDGFELVAHGQSPYDETLATLATLENIIAGIHESIASRVVAMANRVGMSPPVMMTGGVAKNIGVLKALEAKLVQSIEVSEKTQVTGAIGAALIAQKA